jgi:recombination protein RecA
MAMDEANATKALELALAKLEKQYGKNTVFYGDMMPEEIPVISTGNLKLDLALGVGGLPRGRVIEIFGGEGLGKSLIALSTAANCQKEGGRVAFLDVECDLDPDWCRTLGVDVDKMMIAQPETGEETLEIAETLVKTGAVDLIVVDSVAAMSPKAEVEGSMEDNHIGLQARMMAQGLRKLRQPIAETNTCFVFLNQIRDKIGFMQQGTTSPGGRALKFAASVRIELKRMGDVKNKSTGESRGTEVKASVIKNKVARPMVSVTYEVLHGVGFNNYGSMLELGERFGLVTKRGAYYYKPNDDKSFAQGEIAAIQYLMDNPDLADMLELEVKRAYNDK